MDDQARKKTDKKLHSMERKIASVYKQSTDEMTEKWNDYMKRGEKRLKKLYDKYKTSNTKEDYEAYQKAAKEYTLKNKWYKEMVDKTTERMADANSIALSYVNDQLPAIYAFNYKQVKENIDSIGLDYTLLNDRAIKRRILEGDIKLPKKKVKISKDKRWNTKQLNSAVLQGIIQGESMDKIAKRILPIVDRNKKAAIRNARTMVTGAENQGRLDSFKELEKQGAVMRKIWVAVVDSRTRDSHISINGEEANIDDEFSNGLQYPGDPNGRPAEVYNCRCGMKSKIVGFRRKDGGITYVDYGNRRFNK